MCLLWCVTGAVHELRTDSEATLDQARDVVDAWPDDMLMRDVYLHLQTLCAPVMLVDKVHMLHDALGYRSRRHRTRRPDSAT